MEVRLETSIAMSISVLCIPKQTLWPEADLNPILHILITSMIYQRCLQSCFGSLLMDFTSISAFKLYAHYTRIHSQYDLICLKTRSELIFTVPIIHKYSPWVIHLSMYRKGVEVAKSYLRVFEKFTELGLTIPDTFHLLSFNYGKILPPENQDFVKAFDLISDSFSLFVYIA